MNLKVTIGWLYPELMSTYGDRGNVAVLKKRCEWRGLGVAIQEIEFNTTEKEIASCNIIFGGGAQDRQQSIVIADLLKNKRKILKKLFDDFVPGLFVCGSPQLLGHFYQTADGTTLEGLGIFDMETKHPGEGKPRCIGNLVCDVGERFRLPFGEYRNTIVGFENHGGRTYLGNGVEPFAKVLKGYGNNGEDKTEGALFNNCIATYSHGPFLPKNPHTADFLISKALEVKYKKKVPLKKLDDTLEWKAHEILISRLKNA